VEAAPAAAGVSHHRSEQAVAVGAEALLDFNVSVILGDERLTQTELRALLADDDAPASGLVFIKGQWVEVDREKLRQAIKHWRQIEQHSAGRLKLQPKSLRALAELNAST
jgi:non-specific serine/threonine protein kinase